MTVSFGDKLYDDMSGVEADTTYHKALSGFVSESSTDSTMPTGASEKPAGALKSQEGTQVAMDFRLPSGESPEELTTEVMGPPGYPRTSKSQQVAPAANENKTLYERGQDLEDKVNEIGLKADSPNADKVKFYDSLNPAEQKDFKDYLLWKKSVSDPFNDAVNKQISDRQAKERRNNLQVIQGGPPPKSATDQLRDWFNPQKFGGTEATADVSKLGEHADWDKFLSEARRSTNVVDERNKPKNAKELLNEGIDRIIKPLSDEIIKY